MHNLQPVVFCGGQSSRMGTDKALLPSASGNWLLHSATLLDFLPAKILASVNAQQKEQFTEFYPADQLIADNIETVRGPVCGLLSVHEKYPEADVFVLACDLQKMERKVLEQLATVYETHPGYDVYLWTTYNEPEPLCGIYCSTGLHKISLLLAAGQLEKHSMKYLISKLHCYMQPVPGQYLSCFKNFNSHADLNGH